MSGSPTIPGAIDAREHRDALSASAAAYWAKERARKGIKDGACAYSEFVQEGEIPHLQARAAATAAKAHRPESGPRFTNLPPSPARFMGENGRLYAHDDGTWRARDTHTDAFRFKAWAESWYRTQCRRETGLLQDMEKRKEKDAERDALNRQTHELCRRLERNGIQAYRSDAWNVWVYYVHSEEAVMLEKFRRMCFLPASAAALRQGMLRSLEFFGDCYPFLRFWTFTGGQRCKLGEVRSRLQEIHRKISRLNDQPFMKENGVEIVFRSSELGSIEDGKFTKDEKTGKWIKNKTAGALEYQDGEPLFHPHAHCVVYLKNGKLTDPKWTKRLDDVWAYWGHHWDDGSVISDMREVCKYVTKPCEILRLSDKHLVALYWELKGLKMVQPLATLKEDIKRRREADLILGVERTLEGPVYVEVPNWNSKGSSAKEELDMAAMERLSQRPGAPVCAPVARSVPGFNTLGIKEPRIIVFGNVWQPEAVRSHPMVQRMIADTRDEYLAGQAIRVHTGTSTVRTGTELAFMTGLASRTDPPSPPIWESEPPKCHESAAVFSS